MCVLSPQNPPATFLFSLSLFLLHHFQSLLFSSRFFCEMLALKILTYTLSASLLHMPPIFEPFSYSSVVIMLCQTWILHYAQDHQLLTASSLSSTKGSFCILGPFLLLKAGAELLFKTSSKCSAIYRVGTSIFSFIQPSFNHFNSIVPDRGKSSRLLIITVSFLSRSCRQLSEYNY